MTTTTITLPRALLEQALEALEQYTAKELTVGQRYTNEGQRLLDTITDFRAALAQQAEPVDTDCHTQGICQRSGYGITQQAEPVQEPVAWMTHGNDLLPLFHRTRAGALAWGAEPQPLYTAPPQRKPLTDEEIVRIAREAGLGWDDKYHWYVGSESLVRFARLIHTRGQA